MIQLEVKNPLKAWEKLNELFLLQPKELVQPESVGELTNAWYLYDVMVEIKNPIMEPTFDYGKIFHYSITKWSKLIGNYINLDALDELRAYCRSKEAEIVKIRQYSVTANFDNSHDNGKGCLTSIIITRTLLSDKPNITVIIRAAEVTTRLAVDLNFIYRLGEYIFGNTEFSISIYFKQLMALEHLLVIYSKHKDLLKLKKRADNTEILDKVLERIEDMLKSSEEKYSSYAVFFRPYKIIRSDQYKKPKALPASIMEIGNWEHIPLPSICPTLLERNRIKTIYEKMVNKYKMDFTKIGVRNTVKGNNITLGNSSVNSTEEQTTEQDDDNDII